MEWKARRWIFCVALWGALQCGCANPSPNKFKPATDAPLGKTESRLPAVSTSPTVIPIVAITGKVVMSNTKARFVILSLAPGRFPPGGTKLFAYRNGVKVAELKTSGSQWDDKVAADILEGEPQINDLVSDN